MLFFNRTSFNSTLVQLKEGRHVVKLNGLTLFQFYLSSIKRGTPSEFRAVEVCFNSTLVQLKVVLGLGLIKRILCFNSTLVQLKESWKRMVLK